MAIRGKCKYANHSASGNSLHCKLLKDADKKWDFCVCQYFCRVSGKYELTEKAIGCKLKREGVN